MEYCELGDLALQLKAIKQKKYNLGEKTILNWLVQILMALQYIHCRNIIHRDVKPENLLLTSSGTLKLSDFGLSTVL